MDQASTWKLYAIDQKYYTNIPIELSLSLYRKGKKRKGKKRIDSAYYIYI